MPCLVEIGSIISSGEEDENVKSLQLQQWERQQPRRTTDKF